jgi:hypothetical protein
LGVDLPETTTFEEWQEIGQMLQSRAKAIMWLIGDWFLFGEDRFGELAAQSIADDTGYSAKTVQQAAWVCGRFLLSRRLEDVSFSTHMAIAGVEDEAKRYELLELAAKERWTMRQARERVRSLKGSVAPVVLDQGRVVETTDFLFTLYERLGRLTILQKGRFTGVSLDRDTLTDDAVDLIMAFLAGSAR